MKLKPAELRALVAFASGREDGGSTLGRAMRSADLRTVANLVRLELVEVYSKDGLLSGKPFRFTKRRITPAGLAEVARGCHGCGERPGRRTTCSRCKAPLCGRCLDNHGALHAVGLGTLDVIRA